MIRRSASSDSLEEVGSFDYAEGDRTLDGAASGRHPELAVGGDRLCLDRVPGDAEDLADQPEGQMRGQERQQPLLGRGQLLVRRSAAQTAVERFPEVGYQLGEDAEIGSVGKQLLGLDERLGCLVDLR